MSRNLYRPRLLQLTSKLFGFLVLIFLAVPGTGNSQTDGISWKNPTLIAGSDFGRLFQGYYKTGNQEMLLALTAQESRTRYGDFTILNYYSQMQIAYPIKLKAHKNEDNCYIRPITPHFWPLLIYWL